MLSHCMPPSPSYSRESHGRVSGVVSVVSPPPLRPPRPGNLPSAPGLDNKKAPPSFTNTGTGIQTPTEGSQVTSGVTSVTVGQDAAGSGRVAAGGAAARRPGARHDRGLAGQGGGPRHGGRDSGGGEEVHDQQGSNPEIGVHEDCQD